MVRAADGRRSASGRCCPAASTPARPSRTTSRSRRRDAAPADRGRRVPRVAAALPRDWEPSTRAGRSAGRHRRARRRRPLRHARREAGRRRGGCADLACERLGDAARGVARAAATSASALTGALTWGTTATNGRRRRASPALGRARRHRRRRGRARRRRARLPARPQPVGRRLRRSATAPGARHAHHWASRSGRTSRSAPSSAARAARAGRGAGRDGGFEGVPAGPFDSATWVYEDRTDDYVTSEPALDYVANSVPAAGRAGVAASVSRCPCSPWPSRQRTGWK